MADIDRKAICIDKKSAVLYKWYATILSRNENDASYFIKQALLYYIRYSKFVCIGKIHFDRNHDFVDRLRRINLYLVDVPEIQEWFRSLRNSNINPSAAIRQVLTNCIVIVPDSEEEWLPTYLDFISIPQYTSIQTKPCIPLMPDSSFKKEDEVPQCEPKIESNSDNVKKENEQIETEAVVKRNKGVSTRLSNYSVKRSSK